MVLYFLSNPIQSIITQRKLKKKPKIIQPMTLIKFFPDFIVSQTFIQSIDYFSKTGHDLCYGYGYGNLMNYGKYYFDCSDEQAGFVDLIMSKKKFYKINNSYFSTKLIDNMNEMKRDGPNIVFKVNGIDSIIIRCESEDEARNSIIEFCETMQLN
jgi:hypothetical protein